MAAPNADSSETYFSFESHPRLRRSVLDWNTSEDLEETTTSVGSVFDSIRDGPMVDFGTSIPGKWGSDVFISVKTTYKYHQSRLKDILDTWFRLAPENVRIHWLLYSSLR